MDLHLARVSFTATGIFGWLSQADTRAKVAVTLEHAYLDESGAFKPKLPVGKYTCKRGMHQLEGMQKPFEAFEILDVPGHTNILFHVGNTNQDSSGCVLLGESYGKNVILSSLSAFTAFMSMQAGVDTFELEVIDAP